MDLSKITDTAKLHELYVQCNEALLTAQQEVQTQSQNLHVIRARIAELSQATRISIPKENKSH